MYYVIFLLCMLYLFVGGSNFVSCRKARREGVSQICNLCNTDRMGVFASQQPVKCSGADIMRINCGKEGMYV